LTPGRHKKYKTDLKQFWFNLKWIYPNSFSLLVKKWQISTLCILALFSAFYLDEAVRDIVISIASPFWDTVFSFGRWYGNGAPTLYLFLSLYILGYFFNKQKIRETGLMIGEAYAFAGLVTLIFKSVFGRFRPYTNHGDLAFYGFDWSDNAHFSFSSGHANVAFALSMVLASTTKNKYLKILYYIPAVITCFSRIYHNQHWFSDVLAGAMIAILVSSALIELHRLRYKKVSTTV
jgi:membrane-associated phospholipid phosphatase